MPIPKKPIIRGMPSKSKSTVAVPIHITEDQALFLKEMFIIGLAASPLISRGILAFNSHIRDLPQTQGPYPKLVKLMVDPEAAVCLEEKSAAWKLSKAEVVRRILEEGYRLWRLEIQTPRPFSDIFLTQTPPSISDTEEDTLEKK